MWCAKDSRWRAESRNSYRKSAVSPWVETEARQTLLAQRPETQSLSTAHAFWRAHRLHSAPPQSMSVSSAPLAPSWHGPAGAVEAAHGVSTRSRATSPEPDARDRARYKAPSVGESVMPRSLSG